MKYIKNIIKWLICVLYATLCLIFAIVNFPVYVLISISENLSCLKLSLFWKFFKQDIAEYPYRVKNFIYGEYL